MDKDKPSLLDVNFCNECDEIETLEGKDAIVGYDLIFDVYTLWVFPLIPLQLTMKFSNFNNFHFIISVFCKFVNLLIYKYFHDAFRQRLTAILRWF